MKGYKAFNKGLVCNGKQYQENTVYEEQGAEGCCQAGVMHFCETPMDVWDYYPVVDEDGEFSEYAEVEALDKVLEKDNKRATRKLRIGARLSFKDFVKAAVGVVIESTKPGQNTKDGLSDGGGYSAKIGSSGDSAKIGSSGDYAQIGSSGYYAKIGSSGYYAQIGSSGDYAQIGSSGYSAKIGSSGYSAKIGSSGYSAKIGSSGDSAQIGSSGDSAQINLRGTDSVGAAIGYNSIAKGALGNWIVLAEWKKRPDNRWYPASVKAGKIDGDTLKADTWYRLENGEFTEVEQ